MKLFKSFLLSLSFIFLCVQCSVERRLYNKGWNVQWNTKKKGNESLKPETKKPEISETEEASPNNLNIELQQAVMLDSIEITENEFSNHSDSIGFQTGPRSYKSKQVQSLMLFTGKNLYQINFKSKQEYNFGKSQNRIGNGTNVWLTFLLISLFLLFLGILILVGITFELFSIVSWFWLLIGVLFIVIGGIFVIVGLIGLLVNSIVSQEKNFNSQHNVPKDDPNTEDTVIIKEENSSEENGVNTNNRADEKKNGIYIFLACIGALILAYFLL